MTVATILLILGLAIVGVGCVTWRASGRWLILMGVGYATFAGFMLLRGHGSGVRYGLAAAFAVVVVATLVTGGRGVVRRARPELLLLGATALALAGSYFLTDVSSGLQNVLLALFVLLGVSSMVVMLVRTIAALRTAQTSGPK